MGVFLRGKCRTCRKPFATKKSACHHCGAPLEDGVYWYKFRFGGVRIEESSGSRDLETARAEEVRRREEVRRGIFRIVRPDACSYGLPPLFEEYAKMFLAWSKMVHRPATQELHRVNIDTLKRYFSGRRLDEITPQDVENFKQSRSQEPRTKVWVRDGKIFSEPIPGTTVSGVAVNRALTTLSLMFNEAEKHELYKGRNPARSVQRFPEPKRQRILTFEEQERYLQHASETMRDIMVLMTEMGFRPQDLLQLEVGHVDLRDRVIHLWALTAAGAAAKDGKTPGARRTIPITDPMLPVLAKRFAHAHVLGTRWMFPSRRNPQRHIRYSREAHSRALAAAGIPDRVRIYDLRHTGLTRLHEAGVPELTLKYLAGHEKLQTTVRYVRIGNEAKLDALQKLERYKRARSA